MRHKESNIPLAIWQDGTRTLNPYLSALIEKIIASGSNTGDSFQVPVVPSQVLRCVYCLQSICQLQLASGEWFDATVTLDPDGEPYADLLHPHDCQPRKLSQEEIQMQRWIDESNEPDSDRWPE